MTLAEDEEIALYQAFFEKNDGRFIIPAEHETPSIDFRFNDASRECRIWEGYIHACSLLLSEVMSKWPRANSLIFPALFSFRHAIEVALKYNIKYAGGTVPRNAGHNLHILIDAFQKSVKGLQSDDCYISEHFVSRILEIASIDPRSVNFRYATEVDGAPVRISPNSWDIRHLYFSVSILSLDLDALTYEIDRSQNDEPHLYQSDDPTL